jgi:hypothetical protein
MKEYQAVMLRLSRHARDDEDALLMSQDEHRVTLVFERPGDGEG